MRGDQPQTLGNMWGTPRGIQYRPVPHRVPHPSEPCELVKPTSKRRCESAPESPVNLQVRQLASQSTRKPVNSEAHRKERAGVHEGVGAFQREKVRREKVGRRQSAMRLIGVCREARSDTPRRTITSSLSLCNRVLNNFFAILARPLHATIRPSSGSRTAPRLNRSNFQRPARDPACRLPPIAAFPKPTNGSASKVRPSRSASRSTRRIS